MTGFTCIDFEATGFSPKRDRVVEVGVVFVDDDGRVEGEWSTLVNPGRDVGLTSLHGITEDEVAEAPTFRDLVPVLLRSVGGRTVVAHNAAFDTRFLRIELARAGYSWAGPDIPALCTMELSYRYVQSTSRRLVDCCRAAGIELGSAHEALADARATAALLGHLMGEVVPPPPWTALAEEAGGYGWPVCEAAVDGTRFAERTVRAPAREKVWLDRIVASMPRHREPRVDSYLAVLEKALEDRFLSADEQDALVETAIELGLDRERLDAVHRDYLLTLAAVAWADGVVTRTEHRDLGVVARLLGLGTDDVARSLDAAKAAKAATKGGRPRTHDLEPGDLVSLEGELTHPHPVLAALLVERGLRVGPRSAETDLVVTAAPAPGVPAVTEAELLALLLAMPA